MTPARVRLSELPVTVTRVSLPMAMLGLTVSAPAQTRISLLAASEEFNVKALLPEAAIV